MKKFWILNLIGDDRPGIVDEVSKILLKHYANIEDSRMAAFGGCFSIMALFSCVEKSIENIAKELEILKDKGFKISLHEASDPSVLPEKKVKTIEIGVQAMDHPGIVQSLVHLLHSYVINIQSLETKITNAPHSSDQLFHLFLKAALNKETPIEVVKAKVTKLSDKMSLDLRFIYAW